MTTTDTDLQFLRAVAAQRAADAHYKIATRTDDTAVYLHPVYRASERELRMAIARAYGPGLVDLIMDIWVDCGESLTHCATLAKERALDRFEDAEAEKYCGCMTTGAPCVLDPGHHGTCLDGIEVKCVDCDAPAVAARQPGWSTADGRTLPGATEGQPGPKCARHAGPVRDLLGGAR